MASVPATISQILLAVVPVRVTSNGKFVNTYGLLDSASEASMIRLDVAKKLDLW